MFTSYIINPFINTSIIGFCLETAHNAAVSLGFAYRSKLLAYCAKNLEIDSHPRIKEVFNQLGIKSTAESLKEKPITQTPTEKAWEYGSIACSILAGSAWGYQTGMALGYFLNTSISLPKSIWYLAHRTSQDPKVAHLQEQLRIQHSTLIELEKNIKETILGKISDSPSKSAFKKGWEHIPNEQLQRWSNPGWTGLAFQNHEKELETLFTAKGIPTTAPMQSAIINALRASNKDIAGCITSRGQYDSRIQNLKEQLNKFKQKPDILRATHYKLERTSCKNQIVNFPVLGLASFSATIGSLVRNGKSRLTLEAITQIAKSTTCPGSPSLVSRSLKGLATLIKLPLDLGPKVMGTAFLGYKAYQLATTVKNAAQYAIHRNDPNAPAYKQQLDMQWNATTEHYHMVAVGATMNGFIPNIVFAAIGSTAQTLAFGTLNGFNPTTLGKMVVIAPTAVNTFYNAGLSALNGIRSTKAQTAQEKKHYQDLSKEYLVKAGLTAVQAAGGHLVGVGYNHMIKGQIDLIPEGLEFLADTYSSNIDCAMLSSLGLPVIRA